MKKITDPLENKNDQHLFQYRTLHFFIIGHGFQVHLTLYSYSILKISIKVVDQLLEIRILKLSIQSNAIFSICS